MANSLGEVNSVGNVRWREELVFSRLNPWLKKQISGSGVTLKSDAIFRCGIKLDFLSELLRNRHSFAPTAIRARGAQELCNRFIADITTNKLETPHLEVPYVQVP